MHGSADVQVERLQRQVEDLRKHWQHTHEREHQEYEQQLQRKERRNQELQMEIGAMYFPGTRVAARLST